MKLFAVLAAASIAVASAVECDWVTLSTIILGANGSKCTFKSSASFLPPSVPSADKVPKLCASMECRAFLKELKAAVPSECTVNVTSHPPPELYAELINPLEHTCGWAPTMAPTTTTAKPAGGASTVVVTAGATVAVVVASFF